MLHERERRQRKEEFRRSKELAVLAMAIAAAQAGEEGREMIEAMLHPGEDPAPVAEGYSLFDVMPVNVRQIRLESTRVEH